LLHNSALSDEIYDEVLGDVVEQMEESLLRDGDDALICVVAETDKAAMLLVEARACHQLNLEQNAWSLAR
jgi:hypothetical protein